VALFAQPLMRRWLDRTDLAAGLLPVMYAGFSIYYASEALYKTIEGSGRSRYSAVTQVAVLLVQIAGFWALAPLQARGAAWSLVAGFALFSLSNLIMFRSCFPEIRLLTHRQWAALLLPSSVYALGAGLFPPVADPLPFLGYLLAHLVALVRSGLVDTEKLLRRLAAMRDGLSSVAAPAGRETK
jgi:O-antigen/teichoic acid export membrane protein